MSSAVKMLALALLGSVLVSCEFKRQAPGKSSDGGGSSSAPRYLYVSSGACYAGGVAVLAGVQTVSRYSLNSGLYERTLVDYFLQSGVATEFPNALEKFDNNRILIAVETGATTRRIDLLNLNGSFVQTYLSNTAAFNQALRSLTLLPDKSLFVTKGAQNAAGTTGAIEKFSSSKIRITQGASPFVFNPQNNVGVANCSGSNASITATLSLPSSGKILLAHASASGQN